MTTLTPHRSRAIATALRIWRELDYAQRRLFELQTGVSASRQEHSPRGAGSIEQLEALYRVPSAVGPHAPAC